MAVDAYPAFLHFQHLPAGPATVALGPGSLDSQSGADLLTIGGIRRLKGGSTGESWTMNLLGERRLVFGFLHRMDFGSVLPGEIGLYSGGTRQLRLVTESGGLTLQRGTSTIVNTGIPWSDGTSRFVEFAFFIHDTDGRYEIRVDGAVVASNLDDVSGVDLMVTDADIDGLRQLSATSNSDHHLAYLYFKEWESPELPGFYGPIEMLQAVPDSDEAVTWTPDSGLENFTQVDESTHDGDTSYVETSDDENVDRYGMDPGIVEEAVLAVVPFATAIASSGGAPKLQLGLHDGTDDYGPSDTLSASQYRTHFGKAHLVMPGGGAITPANVGTLELLLKAGV